MTDNNSIMYVKDEGYNKSFEEIVLILNKWASMNNIYNADVEFHVNGYNVRDTRIKRSYKHFYKEAD